MLARSALQFTVNHRVPLEKRWGGWYVTGNLGSSATSETSIWPVCLTPAALPNANWPSLEGRFDASGYLTSHSDVVALMVFEIRCT